ncbi:MAG TPA: DUF5678 domain-containing protein [Chloroflexota bacterium]|nr:DUF5678 domain-containing protein [Chloroflexota bacterium]
MTDKSSTETEQTALSPLSPAQRHAWAQSHENWDWINAHPEVLEEYRGRYIAVFGGQVIASGHDLQTFRAALQASPHHGDTVLLLRVPSRDEVDGLLVL